MTNEWQYYAFKLLSRLICLLPYRAVFTFGRLFGWLHYRIAVRQRRRAEQQMIECLAISSEQAELTVRQLFTHVGRTFLEILYMPNLTRANIDEYVTIENKEFLQQALDEKKGIVILTAHIGNWEWLGAALALNGLPVTAVIKRQPNDQHTRLLNEFRQQAGIEVFSRGTTELVGAARALKQGKILGFLADQDAGVNGVFINFLGKMAATPLGPAVFSKKFNSPVVPVFALRCPNGKHRVIVHPPLYYSGDENHTESEALKVFTVQMTRFIEDTIRHNPEQWLWFQKRWNTPYTVQRVEDSTIPKSTEQVGERA